MPLLRLSLLTPLRYVCLSPHRYLFISSPEPKVVLDGILFIPTGNDDIHKSLDEFKIWPDQTTGLHGNR